MDRAADHPPVWLNADWSARELMPSADVPVPPWYVCARCGYELAGLSSRGACPECGTPIERSIRGDLLRFERTAKVEQLLVRLRWARLAIGAIVLLAAGASLRGWEAMGSVAAAWRASDRAVGLVIVMGAALTAYFVSRNAIGGIASIAGRTAADGVASRAGRWYVLAPLLALCASAGIGLWLWLPRGLLGTTAGVLGLAQCAAFLAGTFNLLGDLRQGVRAELAAAMRRLNGVSAGVQAGTEAAMVREPVQPALFPEGTQAGVRARTPP